MEECQSSDTVMYGQREYTEILLNCESDGPLDREKSKDEANTMHISSLDDSEEQEEETWSHTCHEKEILKTEPCVTLYERYVSKIVLAQGTQGLLPHYDSICTLVIENIIFLESVILEAVEFDSVFAENKLNVEIKFQIGSSKTELERALELALMDMYEGEKSEVTLSATNRKDKLKDQNILPVPCLKCVINLKCVESNVQSAEKSSNNSYLLSFLNASQQELFHAALLEKDRGVELFKKKEYVNAFYRFSAGAKIIMASERFLRDFEDKDVNTDGKDILSLYSVLCSNMAECQLKEDNPTQAVVLCQKALAHDPGNVKALYRQALAAWTLGDVDQANCVLNRLLECDPNNIAAKRLNSEVQVKIRKYDDDYAKMMKRIFNR